MNEKMKQRRIDLGITQTELADAIGVEPRSVCRWEANKHLPLKLYQQAIAEYLDCDVSDLWEMKR